MGDRLLSYVVCFMFGVFLLEGKTLMVVKSEELWRFREFDFLVFRMDIFVVYIYNLICVGLG